MAKLSVQERLERLREAGRKQSGQGGQQSSPRSGCDIRENYGRNDRPGAAEQAQRSGETAVPLPADGDQSSGGETAGRKKAGRPTTAGKPGKITSPAREAERRAEELRTLRDEAQQEFLNFRGAEITAGAAGCPQSRMPGRDTARRRKPTAPAGLRRAACGTPKPLLSGGKRTAAGAAGGRCLHAGQLCPGGRDQGRTEPHPDPGADPGGGTGPP